VKDRTLGWVTGMLMTCVLGIGIGMKLQQHKWRNPNQRPCEIRLKASAEQALETYIKLGECRARCK
jgi:hypothetical protein